MIANHWFRQVDNILEAMEITSNATKVKLATFQLKGESHVWWWDWIKALRELKAMTWEELCGLFMEKYFPTSAQHEKDREFLELRQGTMTVLEDMAKFTELARFADDYVAIDIAKVRKLEDGLKFSIQGKIVGLLLQDLDSMVKTAMAIEREVDDAWNIRDAGVVKDKRKESQPASSSLRKKQKTSTPQGFQGQGLGYQGQCDAPTRHPVLGKGVTNLRTINLLTYVILNNYLENISLQKYFIYIHHRGIYNVMYIYYESHLLVL